MKKEFEMCLLGEMSFFLGLSITQYSKGIFISQIKCNKMTLNKFEMGDCKPVSIPMIIVCKFRGGRIKGRKSNIVQIDDWKPTICENLKAKHYVVNNVSCKV